MAISTQRVGDRLRSIRHRKGLSLDEVEAMSNAEFKVSVLGAYERDERVISVPTRPSSTRPLSPEDDVALLAIRRLSGGWSI